MNENIYYKDEMFTIYGTRTVYDHCEFRIYYHGEWIWVKDNDTYPANDKYHYMSESEKNKNKINPLSDDEEKYISECIQSCIAKQADSNRMSGYMDRVIVNAPNVGFVEGLITGTWPEEDRVSIMMLDSNYIGHHLTKQLSQQNDCEKGYLIIEKHGERGERDNWYKSMPTGILINLIHNNKIKLSMENALLSWCK